MLKVAVAAPAVWVSAMWPEAWSALILLTGTSAIFLGTAWKVRQMEKTEAEA